MPNPLYFVENDFGRLGREFIECDRDKNSRADVIRQIRSGGLAPVKILEIDEDAGSCRDVTEELINEALADYTPASLEESCQKLRNMLAEHDRRNDLRKHGCFGW